MTISQKNTFLSGIETGQPIPKAKRAYFQARLQHRLYDYVVTKFQERAKLEGLTKAGLARRIGRKPEVITRLLGSPGNWRLETVSDLLLGIAAEELDMSSTSLASKSPRNFDKPDWLAAPQATMPTSAAATKVEFRLDVSMPPRMTSLTRPANVVTQLQTVS